MARLADNPFYVLDLRPDASRAEVERQGQKLLGMLELGLGSAASYATPVGAMARTPEAVRKAMADLRDPERRLLAELWARLDVAGDDAELDPPVPGPSPAARARAPWPEAMAALRFRRR